TGLYPHTTGITHKAAVKIPAEYLTLPELFKESGYATVAVQSNPVLTGRIGWSTGFDEYLQTWGEKDVPEEPSALRPLIHADKVNGLALPLLGRRAKEEKLFAWIHYTDPHAPYVLQPGHENPFLNDAQFTGDAVVPADVTAGYKLGGRTDLKYYVAQYDANVRVVDEAIRKLLDEARSLGLLDDALVIITADHGESLGEHDSWFVHGPLPYNTTARVPLVFLGTGVPAGRRVDRPVELIDLYPTLRDLIAPGKEVPGLEGHSLAPFLRGESPEDGFRVAYSQAGQKADRYHSVQDESWKLIFNSGGKRSKAAQSPTGGLELYDLSRDPLETNNLAATNVEQVRRLRSDLLAWIKAGKRQGRDEGETTPEAERAIRALGYAN
ncbi:MAG TPA: sulfatase-like hydrolase/transferase, partial [Thermoanaerobaculia bacterium]|nr:sulfatase-like hydrolase/transferase [Thermoanaerobaculia bacterium]